MDFGTLLHKAQKNESVKKEPIRYYSTKFEPPKKEQRNKQLSANIQKFLAKKDTEEKRKMVDAHRKRDDLLALRAQDKKATRRVNVMLKRTKSASQSVLDDTIDPDNTAETLTGSSQPDEDDYGYVSQEASAFYNKMMERYNKMPDEPKFQLKKRSVSTNLNNTKDRVKAALDKERDDALLPHKRKRKHKEDVDNRETVEDEVKYEPEVEKKLKIDKPRPKMPPPINFADLLKVAEKKQFEPIIIEQKPKDDDKLLTKKQKKEMERQREWKERKGKPDNIGNGNNVPEKSQQTDGKNQSNGIKLSDNKSVRFKDTVANNRIPKNSPKSTEPARSVAAPANRDPGKSAAPTVAKQPLRTAQGGHMQRLDSKDRNPERRPEFRPVKKTEFRTERKPEIRPDRRPEPRKPESRPFPSKLDRKTSASEIGNKCPPVKSNDDKLRAALLRDQPKGRPPQAPNGKIESRPRPLPPKDVRQSFMAEMRSKQMSQGNLRPKQFPPGDVRRVPKKPLLSVNKRRIIDDDDDEDEDSEMDDFIDDGAEEEEDYSSAIREIFGYNKSRYRDDDDDVDNMETSFAQQMREECISAKIGIMEDLEDIKLEEQHKKKKAFLKKKHKY